MGLAQALDLKQCTRNKTLIMFIARRGFIATTAQCLVPATQPSGHLQSDVRLNAPDMNIAEKRFFPIRIASRQTTILK